MFVRLCGAQFGYCSGTFLCRNGSAAQVVTFYHYGRRLLPSVAFVGFSSLPARISLVNVALFICASTRWDVTSNLDDRIPGE